jgi:4-aminobutyrate aminotransferase
MSLSTLRRFARTPSRFAIPVGRSITTTSINRLSQPAYASTSQDEEMPAPVRTTAQWAEFGREHVTNGLGRLKDHVMVKGSGLDLYTSEGEKYLDFTAGIGVTNLGQ